MKTILISGATGFLGSNLIKQLLKKQEFKLIILKRKNSDLRRLPLNVDEIKFYNLENGISKIFEENVVDVIVNLVAAYGKKGETIESLINANFLFPIHLISEAIKKNVPLFLQASSSLNPEINDYSLSKHQFEEWLPKFSNDINIINLKMEYFYGKNDDDWKLISMIIQKLRNNEPEILLSSGKQKRDFIYIEDVVSAIILLSRKNDFFGYNEIPIGSGSAISIFDLTNLLKRLLNNTKTNLRFGAIPDRANEPYETKADISILMRLGWEPRFNLEQGLIKTIG